MALPIAWSLCRPVRNPQPDGRALYDFVIGQEATPLGGYSIPSYCVCVCVFVWGLVADRLRFFAKCGQSVRVSLYVWVYVSNRGT